MNSPGCEPGVSEVRGNPTALPKAPAEAQPERRNDSLETILKPQSIHAATLCVSASAGACPECNRGGSAEVTSSCAKIGTTEVVP